MKDQVPVDDPGFRWGRGVFETLVVRSGQAEWQDWHRESMENAARAMRLNSVTLPSRLSPPSGHGIWRWFLTPAGFYTSWEEEIPPAPDAMSLSLSPFRIFSRSWEARFKTLAYLSRLQAREEGETDEVVLLNERGEVASASMANLFIVCNDGESIFTPPLESGCRAGVIRRWVMQEGIKGETHGKSVSEKILFPEDLENAEAIFLTNSRIGICPASGFGKSAHSDHPTVRFLKEKLDSR